MYNKFKKIILIGLLNVPFCSQAIEISSLFNVADKDGSATISIKNTQNKRIFLNAGMAKLEVLDGEIQKTPYNRDNIDDWEIDVRPSRTIIDVGQSKDFKVTVRCKPDCNDDIEGYYQIAFVPTPYFDANEHPDQAVQMAVGFGSVFVNPIEDVEIKYEAEYDNDEVTVENKGRSFLKARIMNCPANTKTENLGECTKAFTVLPGRKLSVKVPENMQGDSIDLRLDTNLDKYQERVKLKNVREL
ncbi:Chaperone [Vibrio sp. B1ASS3]|uniref:hypothetical protein n=1 Tax=Vibrio sp. B1ASS3 TaxID=2751176 RepID=UPI001ABB11A0|nr:hypothetical protein [Vibrio sp. B1ASS3]CAD7827475.1 Chaperone [Vibrio sp. B1ASS3]CAE6964664.1 Chaperone [Vibrio sp. B1ASS3]